MSGRLAVIGLGPGDAGWLTAEAQAELAAAEALYGYEPVSRTGAGAQRPDAPCL